LAALAAALSLAVGAPASAATSGAFTWGYNLNGQLGNGTEGLAAQSDLPVGVCAVGPEAPCPNGPFLSEVTAVSGGEGFSVGLLSNGTVTAWGDNSFGELGNGTCCKASDVPVAVSSLSGVTAVAAGGGHALALLSNGTVMAWGYNGFGQLGNGTEANSDVPIAISGLSEVTAIAAKGNYSMALRRNGTVMAWGLNEAGELGDGTKTKSTVPVEVCAAGPQTPCPSGPFLSNVKAIAAIEGTATALLENGTVMDWGAGGDGGLGNGTEASSDVPVAVSGLTTAVGLPNGGGGMALLANGTVVDWGGNPMGELGVGTTTGPETCAGGVPCSRVPVTVVGITGATAIAGGREQRLAVSSGRVMAWGNNNEGQLGNGTTTKSDVPVAVPGLSEATSVAAGAYHSLATAAILPAPSVTKIEPNHGGAAGGTSVTITGTGFTGATSVKFGANSASSFTVNSPTSITAISAPGTGTADVTVANPNGTSPTTEADRFTYGPTVTKVEPTSGPASGGTTVTITGTNLTGATAVKFGSTNATSFTVNSDSSITAVSPAGTGAEDVTVTTPGGASPQVAADRFTYGPTVTKVEPNIGSAAGATSVTITGTGFSGTTAVKFGSNSAASYTVNSTSSITAVSPAGTGTVDVTVTTPAGTSPVSSADQFTYGPTVTKVEPNRGSPGGGTTVTITGTGFTGATAVKFGSTNAASFKLNSATSITAVSPRMKGGGTVDVTVTTPAGTSPTSSADQFTFSRK
jgi:alpha-tubulin suppressor-like RCC1 family protein